MWIHKGVDISITSNGDFVAIIDDLELRANSLSQIRIKIDAALKSKPKETLSLKVVGLLDAGLLDAEWRGDSSKKDGTIFPTTLIGVNRISRDLQFSPKVPIGYTLEDVVADTTDNRKLLLQLSARRKETQEMEKRLEKLELKVQGYGRIETADYSKVLARLKKGHAESNKRK